MRTLQIGIVADFNIENLVHLLTKHCAPLDVSVTAAPFAQSMRILLSEQDDFWTRYYDALVVWTSPESAAPQFGLAADSRPWSIEELAADVDSFAAVLEGLDRRARYVFVPTWSTPPMAHARSLEMRDGLGTGAALLRMNLRLVERLHRASHTVVLNSERWLSRGGFSDKLWYLSKTPFSKPVFDEAAMDLSNALKGAAGLRRKVIVLDLDNTLWGGIVGDVGWEALRIGGHDPIGEAYSGFQRELRRLSAQGVALAVVSKNEEEVALEAIERHPEMLIRTNDLAAWRINWNDKAENIAELMIELNLGLDSVVFLDDSPHERSRVREALPDILVPEWPSDPMDYARALRELRCFDSLLITADDRSRTSMYVRDRERRELRSRLGSVEEWLRSLDIEVLCEDLSEVSLERAAQLMNKTNQMNLAARRLSPNELLDWASQENHRTWVFRVRDRLGDYGLCGVASVALAPPSGALKDFVLSCRAMGRGVEEAMISVLADRVRQRGGRRLEALYVPTSRNVPCLRWFRTHQGFVQDGDTSFVLELDRGVAPPRTRAHHLTVDMGLVRGLLNRFLHIVARQSPGATGFRVFLHRLRGVTIGKNVFIGDDVYLENEYPDRVEIHDGAQISIRATLLAHTRGPGRIVIEKDAYIGPHVVLLSSAGKSLRIGEGAVIGAGVVVTRDVPARVFIPPNAPDPVARVTVPLARAERIEDFIRGLRPIGKQSTPGIANTSRTELSNGGNPDSAESSPDINLTSKK